MKRLLVGCAAAMAMLSGAAQAACWTEIAVEAAQVRDFETKMMVSMLRCRIKGADYTQAYNRFVVEKRPLLSAASGELRAQFARTVGPSRAMNAYDDYMTKVANSYGGGEGGLSCDETASMLDAAVGAHNLTDLLDLAVRAGSSPYLPEERCPAPARFAALK